MKTFHFRFDTHKTHTAALLYIGSIPNGPQSWLARSLDFSPLYSLCGVDNALAFFSKSANVHIGISQTSGENGGDSRNFEWNDNGDGWDEHAAAAPAGQSKSQVFVVSSSGCWPLLHL